MADNSIRIPVVVELDQATQQLVAFKKTAETQVGGAGVVLQKTLNETEKRTAAATTGMRQHLQGVGPAIAAVTNSFNAMGVQVPRGLGAISTALSSLMMTGIGPLGVALAGGTGLIALMSSTAEAGDKMASSFAATAENAKSARAELERAEVALAAFLAGARNAEVFGAEQELGRMRRRLMEEQRAGFAGANGTESFFRNLGSSVLPSSGFLPGISSAVEKTRELVEEQKKYIETLRASDETERKLVEAKRAQLKEADSANAAAQRGLEIRREHLALEEKIGAITKSQAKELKEALTRFEQSRIPGNSALDEQIAAAQLRGGLSGEISGAGPAPFQFTMPDIPGDTMRTRAPLTPEEYQRAIEEAVRDTDRTFSQQIEQSELSRGIESAASRGLSDAFMDPSNWRDSLASFADAVSRALADAAAQGLVAALAGKGAGFGSGGLLSGIGSLFGGGSGAATEVPAAVEGATMAAGAADAPIMITLVGDEQTADSLLSRASARGFRIGIAKASGDGVAAGSIRRRGA